MTPMDEQAAAGLQMRITPQRRLILEVLASSGSHLDANEIFERVRRLDPRLSLSTVYRTLNALKETGAVRELHLDEEHHHYELKTGEEHSHLVCVSCGRVVELDGSVFAGVAATAAQAHGFQLTSAQVELAGVCAACQTSET